MGIRSLGQSGKRALRIYGPKKTVNMGAVALAQRLLQARPDLAQHRFKLGSDLGQLLNFTVAHGPFTGLRLAVDSWWSAGDRGSMMLGMYEREVLETLDGWRGLADVFVDVGAADGYYAVGCLRAGIVGRAICYEISPDEQAVTPVRQKRTVLLTPSRFRGRPVLTS